MIADLSEPLELTADQNRRIELARMMAAIYEARAHDAHADALDIEASVDRGWAAHAANHRKFAAQYRETAKRRFADARRYAIRTVSADEE